MTKQERIKECERYLKWGKERIPENEAEARVIKEHNDFWTKELNIVKEDGEEASSTLFMVPSLIYKD